MHWTDWQQAYKKPRCDDELLPRETIQTFIDDSLNETVGMVGVRPLEPKVKLQSDEHEPLDITVALSKEYCGKGIEKVAVKKIQHHAAVQLGKSISLPS